MGQISAGYVLKAFDSDDTKRKMRICTSNLLSSNRSCFWNVINHVHHSTLVNGNKDVNLNKKINKKYRKVSAMFEEIAL